MIVNSREFGRLVSREGADGGDLLLAVDQEEPAPAAEESPRGSWALRKRTIAAVALGCVALLGAVVMMAGPVAAASESLQPARPAARSAVVQLSAVAPPVFHSAVQLSSAPPKDEGTLRHSARSRREEALGSRGPVRGPEDVPPISNLVRVSGDRGMPSPQGFADRQFLQATPRILEMKDIHYYD